MVAQVVVRATINIQENRSIQKLAYIFTVTYIILFVTHIYMNRNHPQTCTVLHLPCYESVLKILSSTYALPMITLRGKSWAK